jgi:hypothetical protein
MDMSDKTRKILWARSGNRCVICKQEIVIGATAHDSEAVVGDECHIVSETPGGPRYDPTYSVEKLEDYDNQILLCRVHHKRVDDRSDTYTTDILRK